MLFASARSISRQTTFSARLAIHRRIRVHVRQFSDVHTSDDPTDTSISDSHLAPILTPWPHGEGLIRRLREEEDYSTIYALRKFLSIHNLSRFKYQFHPDWPSALSDLREIFTLLQSLPQETPALVPEEVEKKILELAGRGQAPPRTVLGEVTSALMCQPLRDRSAPPVVVGRVAERLLRISWNSGDTEYPQAGSLLLAPLTLRLKGHRNSQSGRGSLSAPQFRKDSHATDHIRMGLCSHEEAAGIYSALSSLDDAHFSWARRLSQLIRDPASMLRNEEVLPGDSELRADFDKVIRKLVEICDNESTSAEVKCDAMRFLAAEYARGWILPRDGSKAREFWERAADLEGKLEKSQFAAYRLGQVYLGLQPKEFGSAALFEPDVAKGLAYHEIAKARVTAAALNLGRIYAGSPSGPLALTVPPINVDGVERDDQRAAENFYVAGRSGNSLARIALAEMILLGRAQPPAQDAAEVYPDNELLEGLWHTLDDQAGGEDHQYVYRLLRVLYNFNQGRWREWISPDSPIQRIVRPQFAKLADAIQKKREETRTKKKASTDVDRPGLE